jgi:ribosomal-protein-serine acetyltransferase
MLNLKVDDEIDLRLVHPDYANMHFEVAMANKEHIGRWLEWIYKYQSGQDSLNFINFALEKYERGEALECFIFYQDKLVGSVGFGKITKANNSAEIGYWLASDYCGKGIMTKSVKTLVEYGFNFLNLHRIYIKAATGNEKSANIPRKLGFTQDAILRDEGQMKGKYYDVYYFSLLKSEFNNNK